MSEDSLTLLTDLIAAAKKAGADTADAILADGESITVTYRLGELEQLERSEGGDIGLRVLVGQKQAIVSSSSRAIIRPVVIVSSKLLDTGSRLASRKRNSNGKLNTQ